jgi:hypothetical protein
MVAKKKCMSCGGSMKKMKMQKGGSKKGIFTPTGRLESKKTRDVDTGFSPNSSVSKTKRDGTVVTKSINTSQGFVPTARATKTVTDKEGNEVSNETKDIKWNKAVRKVGRVAKNVGRNENDTYAYKKGGTTRKMQDGGPNLIQSMRRNMLTNRANRLDNKGVANMKAGNVEKGRAQFEKSDDLGAKRRRLAEKYKTGGSTGIVGMPKYGNDPRTDAGRTLKKGGTVKSKMKMGGSLKPVPTDKVGLAKLPTAVRNKMGFQKKGGVVKKKK